MHLNLLYLLYIHNFTLSSIYQEVIEALKCSTFEENSQEEKVFSKFI